MEYFNYLYSTISSYLRPSDPNADETALIGNKRQRSNDDDEDEVIVVNDSPPKRQKFSKEDLISGDIPKNIFRSFATQTHSEFLVPKKSDRVRGIISSQVDSSWALVEDDDVSRSPSKFKNLYKAPKHVRSPRKRRPTQRPASPTNNSMSIDLTGSSENIQPKAPTRRNSTTLGGSLFRVGFSYPCYGMSYNKYEKLLGSLISNSAKEAMKNVEKSVPKENITCVDLTDGDDGNVNTPTIDLTRRSFGIGNPFSETSRNTISVIHPNIINVNEIESPTRRKVERVNSFQEKIDNNPFTKPDVIEKGMKDYDNQAHRFLRLKAQCEQKARCESEASLATLHEIIEKRLRTHLKITESILIDEEEEEITTEKPVLTPQMLSKVQNAQNPTLNPSQVLVSKFKLDMTRADFMTLKGLNWLNDSIINFYMELIVERSGTEKKYPSVYAFSTFFYPSLGNGYDRVRRYTRKVDLFSKDLILVPIHLSVHWCMAKIDMKRKEIVYYDSMLSSNTRVLETLMNYLNSEHKDKKKEEFDSTGWSSRSDKDIPTQKNGSDCGVFACTFAEYSARNSIFNFSQADMPYMRSKMCYEILTGKLLL